MVTRSAKTVLHHICTTWVPEPTSPTEREATMTTTTDLANVPTPAGVTRTDKWQDDVPRPYRVLFGELRNTGSVKFTTVQATAIQFGDGRIDDASVYDAPHVYLGDDALTSAQARALAAALIETADEVDRWAASSVRHGVGDRS